MVAERNILDVIEALAAARPFAPEQITQITGIPLEGPNDHGNPYFEWYENQAVQGSPIQWIELRKPTPLSNRIDGLIYFELASPAPISLTELFRRYGHHWRFKPPRPIASDLEPWVYTYRWHWGTVEFGLDRTRSTLRTIVMNADR